MVADHTPSNAWREAALAFELRAMRVEYVIRLLVAAGHVTQEKVDEAFNLARDFKRADGVRVPDAVRDQHGCIVLHNGREVCYRDEVTFGVGGRDA